MVATRAFLKSVFGIVLIVSLTCCGTKVQKSDERVVLPNMKLTGCSSPNCSLIWPDKSSEANAAYPKHVSVDLDNSSIRAVMATYDQSVSMDEIKAAVDQRYGKWALATDPNSRMRLWRVEPEKFAISLSEDQDGTKSLFYLAFRPNAQVFQDMTKAMTQNPSDCGAVIGKQITIHGKFSLVGKFGPYIEQDNQQVVYLVPSGSFTWGKPYSDMEGKLVAATGILRFYHAPPFKPSARHVAHAPDYFYFEPETVQLRLIER